MKDKHYTSLICEMACSFYKPGKEDLLCEGYRYLVRTYSGEALAGLMDNSFEQKVFESYRSQRLKALLCEACDFRIDGCDFAEDCSGPPCGGYKIIHCLLVGEAQKREEKTDALGE